jgi:hypothetical protein
MFLGEVEDAVRTVPIGVEKNTPSAHQKTNLLHK